MGLGPTCKIEMDQKCRTIILPRRCAEIRGAPGREPLSSVQGQESAGIYNSQVEMYGVHRAFGTAVQQFRNLYRALFSTLQHDSGYTSTRTAAVRNCSRSTTNCCGTNTYLACTSTSGGGVLGLYVRIPQINTIDTTSTVILTHYIMH